MGSMFTAMSPARRRFALALVVLATVAGLLVAITVVRAVSHGGVQPVSQDIPGPVLLVPGYGGSTLLLDPLAQALRDDGRDVTIVAPPGAGRGDLSAAAEALGEAVAVALAGTDEKSVDVVGYSAGGVVARLWVREFGGGDQARRIVTLGSPHHGTNVAGFAVDVAPTQCPKACQQMAPESDLLRALNARDETPDGPEFVSIWTTTDEVVIPPDTAELDGAANIALQDYCPGVDVSHGELPVDPVVIGLVLSQISQNATGLPAEIDCTGFNS